VPLSRGRRLRVLLGFVTTVVLLAGCSDGNSPARSGGTVRVASFDFDESRTVAEVYAAALRRSGFPVQLIDGIGSREIVEPALEHALVDVVPEYLGSAVAFLSAADGATVPATGTAPTDATALVSLRSALAGRGLVALHPAPAQDRNGVAVTAATARARGLRRISDLQPLAARFVFGGPPECPQRPYCLPGLRSRYRLGFASFAPMPTRAVTAEALLTGEIQVGMLETSSAELAGGRLVLLRDDAGLQPAENVVPVLRRRVLTDYGPRLAATLDAVSARLSTATLIALNRAVEVDGVPAARVAAAWVTRLP
jgi:osmoprotectant transport system substrate-binding protein